MTRRQLQFWRNWFLVHLASTIVIYVSVWIPQDPYYWFTLSLTFFALPAAQAWMLRRYTTGSWQWVIWTGIGLAGFVYLYMMRFAFALGNMTAYGQQVTWVDNVIFTTSLALTIAVPQWLFFHFQNIDRTYLWPSTVVLAVWLWMLIEFPLRSIWTSRGLMELVSILIVTYGLLTGLALTQMLYFALRRGADNESRP